MLLLEQSVSWYGQPNDDGLREIALPIKTVSTKVFGFIKFTILNFALSRKCHCGCLPGISEGSFL
jgi:hypothetical protein